MISPALLPQPSNPLPGWALRLLRSHPGSGWLSYQRPRHPWSLPARPGTGTAKPWEGEGRGWCWHIFRIFLTALSFGAQNMTGTAMWARKRHLSPLEVALWLNWANSILSVIFRPLLSPLPPLSLCSKARHLSPRAYFQQGRCQMPPLPRLLSLPPPSPGCLPPYPGSLDPTQHLRPVSPLGEGNTFLFGGWDYISRCLLDEPCREGAYPRGQNGWDGIV